MWNTVWMKGLQAFNTLFLRVWKCVLTAVCHYTTDTGYGVLRRCPFCVERTHSRLRRLCYRLPLNFSFHGLGCRFHIRPSTIGLSHKYVRSAFPRYVAISIDTRHVIFTLHWVHIRTRDSNRFSSDAPHHKQKVFPCWARMWLGNNNKHCKIWQDWMAAGKDFT